MEYDPYEFSHVIRRVQNERNRQDTVLLPYDSKEKPLENELVNAFSVKSHALLDAK